MIRIVNWLLTRRCNLNCSYCGIVDNRKSSPFLNNEISTDRVIKTLDKFQNYNPDVFHIFYGGEPFLRNDIGKILKHCNDNDINYTIISNCTPTVQKKILSVMEECGGFKGFTGSVDPIILMTPEDSDQNKKSAAAFYFLVSLKHDYKVKDVVAEITMDRKNFEYTYDLVKMLSGVGIYSSITAIDVNKNHLYDFAAFSYIGHLLSQNTRLKKLYEKIMKDDTLLIHMKDVILEELFRNIRSTYDCKLEDGLHNLTIDADGSLRTCLRMKGIGSRYFNVETIFTGGNNINPHLNLAMKADKDVYCRGCNHTCVMMSRHEDGQRIINH